MVRCVYEAQDLNDGVVTFGECVIKLFHGLQKNNATFRKTAVLEIKKGRKHPRPLMSVYDRHDLLATLCAIRPGLRPVTLPLVASPFTPMAPQRITTTQSIVPPSDIKATRISTSVLAVQIM